jgi:NAD(P)-dependent dehydrogenase (short-subunit alcohol dehydrogenase family)
VITGASDGIGAAAARRLSRSGEHVVVVGRSVTKTLAVAAELGADSYVTDFAELHQVRQLAAALLERYPRIDMLANNAGGIMGQRRSTVDGHELTFQVNHLAPFLLTSLLLDRLVESGARIVNTSSAANRFFGHLDIDDLDAEIRYAASKAYGDAKLANILFTKELDRRHGKRGISTAAFHPGNVATNFSSESDHAMRLVYQTPLRHLVLISADKGADTLVWLANARPGVDWTSGEFYRKGKVFRANKQAYDPLLARELWDRSTEMVALD